MSRILGMAWLAAGLLNAAEVRINNEFVRVIFANDPPGGKTSMHKHDPNRVMVFLDDGEQTITYADGRVEKHRWKAGQVAWTPGGPLHISENSGSGPLRVVEVEVKQEGQSGPERNPKLDPVATDAKHNILLLENSQVRVFRSWREAGGSETLHEHTGRGRVVVMLTPIQARVRSASGEESTMTAAAADTFWSAGAVQHAGTNTGRDRFDMILIEVK